MKFIAVKRERWVAMDPNQTFDELEAKVDGELVKAHEVSEKKHISNQTGWAMVYRGEAGIVEGLACLHMQGW